MWKEIGGSPKRPEVESGWWMTGQGSIPEQDIRGLSPAHRALWRNLPRHPDTSNATHRGEPKLCLHQLVS